MTVFATTDYDRIREVLNYPLDWVISIKEAALKLEAFTTANPENPDYVQLTIDLLDEWDTNRDTLTTRQLQGLTGIKMQSSSGEHSRAYHNNNDPNSGIQQRQKYIRNTISKYFEFCGLKTQQSRITR